MYSTAGAYKPLFVHKKRDMSTEFSETLRKGTKEKRGVRKQRGQCKKIPERTKRKGTKVFGYDGDGLRAIGCKTKDSP